MSRDALLTYLNDHLAGSVAALELLDLLLSTGPASERGAYREVRT